MKILFIIPNLFRGGAEYQLLELCRSLRREPGIQIKVLAFYSEAARDLSGYYQEIRELGITVDTLFDTMVTGLPLLRATRAYLRSQPSDIIQAFLQANQYASLAALALPGKLFLGIRSDLNLSRAQRALGRLLDFRVQAYVGNAQFIIRHYAEQVGCAPHKAVAVYNGIDLERLRHTRGREEMRRELEIPDQARAMITVANMHFPFKGHQDLLDAWCRHAPSAPDDHMVLAGTGKMEASLKAQASQAGLERRTHFLGMRADVMDLLGACDLYISPSWVEGFSNSIAEAILCGLPVVATRVGGTPEMVTEGSWGALVPPRDSDSLAEAMARTYQPPTPQVLQAFRSKVDLNHLGQDYLSLYRRALA